ncbi:30S ribosomal protein S6 [Thalassospira sp.]|uniref:30S ribosomal protein S6 n=1 Tax=Thalassospira sp. TaxID=1912094 RepID=UPI002733257A|nr:30S ribosomal protein S6 [Thalassospira sp.]MDP2700045.1 30S ribosomal protein S6 [Thalassospira sp.]
MSKYESVYIARQDFSTAQVEALNEKMVQVITELGATVAKTEYWGLRALAYRVNKNRKGHYTLFQIDADKDAIAEYERQMRLNEDVLREMTVKVDAFEEEQSAILRNRDERGSRGPRGPRGPRPN